MKKFLLSLFALLGVGTYALADGFSVADVEIRSGKSGVLELVFNTSFYGRSFQVDFDLPEGIEASTVQKGAAVTAAEGQYMLGGNVTEGIYRVAYTDFDGSILQNGVAAYITLNDTKGFEPGTEFTVTVKNQEYLYQETTEAGSRLSKANPEDFTFKIKIVEDLVVLDETSTDMPIAATNQKILVKRTIKANEWSTLCLPFDMTADQVYEVFGEDVQLAYLNGDNGYTVEKDDDGNVTQVTINFVSDDLSEDFTGNYPYLIKTSKDISEFELTANLNPSEVKESWSKGKGTSKYSIDFIGTYQAQTTVPTDNLFLNSNKFYYSTGKTKMKAFRCYFNVLHILADKGASVSSSNVKMQFGVTTKIDGVRLTDSEGAVYTVDGKFVGRNIDLKKLHKGIYVVNGKKVAIK